MSFSSPSWGESRPAPWDGASTRTKHADNDFRSRDGYVTSDTGLMDYGQLAISRAINSPQLQQQMYREWLVNGEFLARDRRDRSPQKPDHSGAGILRVLNSPVWLAAGE